MIMIMMLVKKFKAPKQNTISTHMLVLNFILNIHNTQWFLCHFYWICNVGKLWCDHSHQKNKQKRVRFLVCVSVYVFAWAWENASNLNFCSLHSLRNLWVYQILLFFFKARKSSIHTEIWRRRKNLIKSEIYALWLHSLKLYVHCTMYICVWCVKRVLVYICTSLHETSIFLLLLLLHLLLQCANDK